MSEVRGLGTRMRYGALIHELMADPDPELRQAQQHLPTEGAEWAAEAQVVKVHGSQGAIKTKP